MGGLLFDPRARVVWWCSGRVRQCPFSFILNVHHISIDLIDVRVDGQPIYPFVMAPPHGRTIYPSSFPGETRKEKKFSLRRRRRRRQLGNKQHAILAIPPPHKFLSTLGISGCYFLFCWFFNRNKNKPELLRDRWPLAGYLFRLLLPGSPPLKWLFRETCLGAIFKDRLAVAFRTRCRFVSLDAYSIVAGPDRDFLFSR